MISKASVCSFTSQLGLRQSLRGLGVQLVGGLTAACLALSVQPAHSQTAGQPAAASASSEARVVQPSAVISPDNADRVVQLAVISRGAFRGAAHANNSNVLAVATALGIHIYDSATLKETRFIQLDTPPSALALSPDGQFVAIAQDQSQSVQLRRVSDGKEVWTYGELGSVDGVEFSLDGQILIVRNRSWGGQDARLLRANDGALVQLIRPEVVKYTLGSSGVKVAVAPDGRLVIVYSLSGTPELWQVRNGKPTRILLERADEVESVFVYLSPDGQLLLAERYGKLYAWRTSDGKLLWRHYSSYWPYVSPDNQLIATWGDSGILLLRADDGSKVTTLTIGDAILGMVFAGNSQRLFVFAPEAIQLWQTTDAKLLQRVQGFSSKVSRVAFLPDSRTLVRQTEGGGRVELWAVADGKLVSEFRNAYRGFALSPNGRLLALLNSDKVVLSELPKGDVIRVLDADTNSYIPLGHSGAFSPDQEVLAAPVGLSVYVWRVSDGELLYTLQGHQSIVSHVSISPDGQIIATVADSEVRFWRLRDGKLLRTQRIEWASKVVFSPDGQAFSTGSYDSSVRLWRVSDGKLLQTFNGHKDSVSAVAFSPDGQLLASASHDRTVRLWRVSDGVLLRTLEGHADSPLDILFSPDGRLLATAGRDGTTRLWGVK